MGILSNIFRKIFPSSHPASQTATAGRTATLGPASPASSQAPAPAPSTVPAALDPVDVEAILDAKPNAGSLNWKTSIVDLLKLLDLDSSLQSRKELAAELDYAGDAGDSAAMNIWLHRQVMNKLAANGGRVPADLKD